MSTSQNGWPAGQDRRALGVDQEFSAGGVLIAGGVLAGDVATVLGYVAEQFHRRVEKLVAGWCWGHAYRPIRGQTTGLSNHASATAMDLNAPNHPQGRRGTFTTARVREIRKILAEVGGVVRWGGDWSGASVDEMHFEINGTRAQVAAVAARLRGTTQEDDMPTAKEIADAVWTSQVTNVEQRKSGKGAAWAQDKLSYIDQGVWVLRAEVAAMRASQDKLVDLVADGSGADAESIKAAIREAIRENVLQVEVAIRNLVTAQEQEMKD